MTIREDISKRRLIFDGAMGTMLQERGLTGGELPELWNMTHPEIIRDIHALYLDAGCDIIKTNTFGANALKMTDTPYDVEEIVQTGVTLAREAVEASGRRAYVALDIGPTGKLLQPLGDLSFDRAVELFAEVARAGQAAGADLILIETMSDTYEAKAAVLAAKEATDLPVFLTVIMDEKGKLLTGGDAAVVAVMFEGLGVDALGLNCGLGPEQMAVPLAKMQEYCSLPLICNPNAGLPRSVDGRTVFDIAPGEFAEQVAALAKAGTTIVGGCCGTTPAHLREVVRLCRKLPLPPERKSRPRMVCSYTGVVEIGSPSVVVGERINPTGKARFKQALRDQDMDYILQEGITQMQDGAHILDVNVGLPDIDEVSRLEQVVRELQSVVDLPLQMDTSNPEAMERALRCYNGKALINSVNGKEESMRAVFPLVKKYGGVVVALALDEEGIPETPQGRLAVARRIVETAAQYGIDRRDILVDALTMTISTGSNAAKVTLEALKLIKRELGVGTILGVSNISFGLPRRELVNATFYTMALQNGLDAAIINPHSMAMMDAYRASLALTGQDDNCTAYIARYADQAIPVATSVAQEDMSLTQAIEQGLKDRAYTQAERLLQDISPLEIIENRLVPALDTVGKGFEKGTIFLPQLLMSAEAAKAAFEAIRLYLSRAGEQPVKKGKIVLATVKGDIHDIGKNIVKVLLQNYNYDVIDLGKDVDPQLVVDTVLREKVPLVGLSALMTTTVPSMEETIRLLHEACPDCKVMVGGAVLTEEYARMIHADQYSPDAMASVHYAEKLFGIEE